MSYVNIYLLIKGIVIAQGMKNTKNDSAMRHGKRLFLATPDMDLTDLYFWQNELLALELSSVVIVLNQGAISFPNTATNQQWNWAIQQVPFAPQDYVPRRERSITFFDKKTAPDSKS